MDLSQDFAVHMGMKVSPRLVAASYILELSAMELQQAIATEISENPAIEVIERPTCPTCGEALHGSICPNCLRAQKPEASPDSDYEGGDDYLPDYSLSTPLDDDFDPMTQVATQMSLSERLQNELQAIIPHEDALIAEYLVGHLNDNGYIQCTVEDAAANLSLPAARVETVLKALQSLDPIGIGSRDLRECLLIQIDFLEDEKIKVPPYTRSIVERHLTELAEHKYGKIASGLGIPVEMVNEAAKYIREKLNPFPSRGGSAPEPGTSETRANAILPDVVINYREGEESSGEFEVDVIESKRYFLRVAPIYQRIVADLDREPERYNDDDKRHIKQYVSRAKLFIANINQRRQTMHKITEYIVEAQKEFLRKGIRALKPLTRASVAVQLGMHESTVSRATAAKYVMLPNRKVIPFSNFFTASLSVMDVIKELIATEKAPMTDQEIADQLARRSIVIARRTVAKYREQLNILPSSLRQPGMTRQPTSRSA